MTTSTLVRRLIPAGLLLAALAGPRLVGATPTPPPAPPPVDLNRITMQIVIRTTAGQPVPGLGVQLAPAPADQGGPPAGTPAQTATTDSAGAARFVGLGAWIWRATLTGSYQGRPLQAVADQGRPPQGTNPAGGGFLLLVQAQDESDPPTRTAGDPTPDTSTPGLESTGLVLLPMGAEWQPALDLADGAHPPQPLPAVLTPAADDTPTPGPGPSRTGTAAPGPALVNPYALPPAGGEVSAAQTPDLGGINWSLLLWVLPLCAAGGAGLQAARQWMAERAMRRAAEQRWERWNAQRAPGDRDGDE